MPSMAGSEQLEALDSPEINTLSSYSIVSKKRNCTSKIWDYPPVSRDEVLLILRSLIRTSQSLIHEI